MIQQVTPKVFVLPYIHLLLLQLSHEAHDAAKVFRGRYTAALGKMRSRQAKDEELGGLEVASMAPPVFRPTKAPKRTYVTSTEL